MDGKGRFLDTVFIQQAYAAVISHNRKAPCLTLREGDVLAMR